MVRLSTIGIVYTRILMLTFGILSFLAIKDINFSSIKTPPDMSPLQTSTMIIFLGLGLLTLIIFTIHALVIKTPPLSGFGVLSLFVIYTGLLAIIGTVIYGAVATNPESSLGIRMIITVIGSVFILLGSYILAYRKFSEDQERAWFIEAVRQELKDPSMRSCPYCSAVIPASSIKCPECKRSL